ncbi:multiple coagulation factor deficiency protein 2 homolog [Eurytemora carolleeae]|uniref:multiple coagulation factor deficiency protein 2 homolog n=1 Tax=Eurytemora carolleeae TaxID=1294199 RepID=UPI000C78FB7C|nr:multiple coagulation factor deficiency protein 2 homolog [Eurytemora carolleeae]|eukprot:XP_023345143.1 multiple coagulation factor deficiency protein 2 homolog [Eurytemora affinis]
MIRGLTVFVFLFLNPGHSWVPPGMSERTAEQYAQHLDNSQQHQNHQEDHQQYLDSQQILDQQNLDHQEHQNHRHNDNSVVQDLVLDSEHLMDDFKDLFSSRDIETMELDQKLFLWFNSHDWDMNTKMDGLELFKALSHDHNYHHDEDHEDPGDSHHDPFQHSPPAQRQRLRRTEKIVDKILNEDDLDLDGALGFVEFAAAFHSGKMAGLKVKK